MSESSAARVLVVGTGAQAKYVLETFSHRSELVVAGLVHLGDGAPPDSALGQPVLGTLAELETLLVDADAAIVCCADSHQKRTIFTRIRASGVPLIVAIHPAACIARTATVGEGVIINACAVVQPFARIGDGAMIHAAAVVEHDDIVGEFANLAPGVKLAGWVKVGEHARVLTGACVIPSVEIGANATVGAGAVVLEHVADGVTVVGNPARAVASSRPSKDGDA